MKPITDTVYVIAAWVFAVIIMFTAWHKAGKWKKRRYVVRLVKDPPLQTVFKIPSDCEDQP